MAIDSYWRAHPIRADQLARALATQSAAPTRLAMAAWDGGCHVDLWSAGANENANWQHCDGTMGLVRRPDFKDMPEIYIFHCSRWQHATVKQERAD